MKLITCNCGQGQRHKAGTHMIGESLVGRTVLGNEIVIREHRQHHSYCRCGKWQEEETITVYEAEEYGIIPPQLSQARDPELASDRAAMLCKAFYGN